MNYYSIMLMSTGFEKIRTIKVICNLTGVGLAEAKHMVENTPVKIASGLTEDEANTIKSLLSSLGNKVQVEKDYESLVHNTAISSEYLKTSMSGINNPTTNDEFYKTLYGDSYNSSNTYNYSSYTNSNGQKNKKKSDGTVFAVIAVTIFVVIVFAIFISVFIYLISSAVSSESANNSTKSNTGYMNGATIYQDTDGLYGPNNDLTLQEYMGTFEAWNLFANEAFGKDFAKLKKSELNQVVYIDYNRSSNGINSSIIYLEYKLEDGTTGIVPCPYKNLEFVHFTIFEKLEYLDSFCLKDTKRVFYDFPSLKHIGVEIISFSDLPEFIDTTHITSINSGSYFGGDFSKFPNLESLEIEVHEDGYLDGIDVLDELKELTIHHKGASLDAANLVKLTSLESLHLDGSCVKDIQFIKKLPNLKAFGIYNTSVVDISSLADMNNQLEELYLDENYYIEDYSVVCNMTNLKKLTLLGSFSFDSVTPDLSRLTDLVELKLGRFHDSSSLYTLTNIEKLVLYSPYFNDAEFLLNMPKLRELRIEQASLYSSEIYTVAKCESIEVLSMYSTFIWDDISMVFNMPNLRWLDLNDASFGVMTDRVELNDTLEYLNLDYARLYTLDSEGQWYWDNEKIDLVNMQDTFNNLEGLKYLYIPDHMFTDLNCISNCKELLWLDIKGNYITDLTPIKDLPLMYIEARGNQIYDYAGFDDIVDLD